HTRFSRDWSSDVCSSDLKAARRIENGVPRWQRDAMLAICIADDQRAALIVGRIVEEEGAGQVRPQMFVLSQTHHRTVDVETIFEIGRASCREREKIAGIA